jgi:hypothetical protein
LYLRCKFPARQGDTNALRFGASRAKSGEVKPWTEEMPDSRPEMTGENAGLGRALRRHAFAIAVLLLASPSGAEPYGGRFAQHVSGSPPVIAVANEDKRQEPDTDILALPTGKCSTLKIAGRDFACRAVAFFQNEQGRANFVIALDDPADGSHIITFSGDNGRREKDDQYELQIDRMLLNSKDRPKVDGLPVPVVELSTGTCKQLGNLTKTGISSIACSATDRNGKSYELRFESDGSPTTVRRIVRSALVNEKRRTKQIEQLQCRHKADAAKILPRDRTAYIIGCLEKEDSQKPATDQ